MESPAEEKAIQRDGRNSEDMRHFYEGVFRSGDEVAVNMIGPEVTGRK